MVLDSTAITQILLFIYLFIFLTYPVKSHVCLFLNPLDSISKVLDGATSTFQLEIDLQNLRT